MEKVQKHYDLLIDENNDPVDDPIELKNYMDQWDGERFIKSLNLSKDQEVLEIGIGTGRLALKVVPFCKKLTGIDLSWKTIERAKRHLVSYDVDLICDDFLKHEFNKTFDVIYSSLTFMHFINKEEVFKKIYHLLNSKGTFVLSIDKNQDKYLDYGTRKIEIYPSTKEEIHTVIDNTNFSIIEEYETELAWIFNLKK